MLYWAHGPSCGRGPGAPGAGTHWRKFPSAEWLWKPSCATTSIISREWLCTASAEVAARGCQHKPNQPQCASSTGKASNGCSTTLPRPYSRSCCLFCLGHLNSLLLSPHPAPPSSLHTLCGQCDLTKRRAGGQVASLFLFLQRALTHRVYCYTSAEISYLSVSVLTWLHLSLCRTLTLSTYMDLQIPIKIRKWVSMFMSIWSSFFDYIFVSLPFSASLQGKMHFSN